MRVIAGVRGRGREPVTTSLVALLALAPFAIGGVPAPARAAIELAILGIASLQVLREGWPGRGPRSFRVGVALVAWAAVQLVPLPHPVAVACSRLRRGFELVSGQAPAWAPLALDPWTSLDHLVGLALALALAGVVARIRSRRQLRHLLEAVAATGVAVAVVGLLQKATWNGRILWFYEPVDWTFGAPVFHRTSGPFVNPNHFAAYLVLAASAAGALVVLDLRARKAGQASRVLGWGAALAFMTLGILASLSRGGLLALAVAAGSGLAVIRQAAARHETRERHRRWARRLTAAGVLAAAAFVAAYLGSSGWGEVASRWAALGAETDAGPGGRIAATRASLAAAVESPLGVGLGAWSLAANRHLGPPHHVATYRFAHDDPLQLAVELGLPGLVGMLVGLVIFLAEALRRSETGHVLPRPVRLVILAGLGAFTLQSLVEFPFRVPACAALFATLAGAVLATRGAEKPGVETVTRPGRRPPLGAVTAAGVVGLVVVGPLVPVAPDGPGRLRSPEVHARAGWAELTGLETAGRVSPEAARRALAHFEAARRRTLARHDVHLGIALTSPEPDAAVRALETAIFLRPHFAPYRDQLVLIGLAMGEGALAREHLETSLYLEPRLDRHPALLDPARSRRLDPPLARAVEQGLRRAAAGWADPQRVGRELARFFRDRGDLASEARTLAEILALPGARPEDGLVAARQLRRVGLVDEAASVEGTWLDRYAGHRAAWIELLEYHLSFGATAEVTRLLAEARAKVGPGPDLDLVEARLALAGGRLESAEELARRSVEDGAPTAPALGLLGATLARRGDVAGARRALERAVLVDPDDGFAQRELAMVHDRRRDLERALAHYERALAAGAPGRGWIQGRVAALEADLRGEGAAPLLERAPGPCLGVAGDC